MRRVSSVAGGVVLAALAAACGGCPGPTPVATTAIPDTPAVDRPGLAAEVVEVKKKRESPGGQLGDVVYVDWKNTGDGPVRELYVTILVRTSAGDAVLEQAVDVCVFRAKPGEPGVPPGETHRAAAGEGYVVRRPASMNTANVVAKVTRIVGGEGGPPGPAAGGRPTAR